MAVKSSAPTPIDRSNGGDQLDQALSLAWPSFLCSYTIPFDTARCKVCDAMRMQGHMIHSLPGTRRSFVRTAFTLTSALATITAIGCGDDGLGKRYPVSGTVTYNDKPVESGTISFYPVGGTGQTSGPESRGASGVIKDGKYTLSTQGEDDGAFAGDYEVSISARVADMTQAKANAEKSGGSFRQDDVAKAYAKSKSPIPLKYESTSTSKLTAKVEAKSNTIDFKLTD
jgi:hypothetical protein